ncbi:PD-(D/E)XK nuclease-like domain-containing protein [Arthrobacter russicus]|uniref:Putative exodeoxyribonuclease 8 PDDEXK-like domain-containing protein n=1 Tax=Arthrobacter russicus TaxID=172040 RepID=A0ABU1JBV4_9MICC|nr:PD-(D/E)XK nuclease-like domain-containing protein [Arthrobacter russicus]MDR6268877.1 hypothetical protein [Arthrobacter russicus]
METLYAGIVDRLSSADYHRYHALGSTSLKTLAMRTPAHYQWDLHHRVEKKEFDLGTAAHSMILENDDSRIVQVNFDSWISRDAKEARAAAYADGLTPLLIRDYRQVVGMRDAVMAHPLARQAFTNHKAETSVFWKEDGLDLKCRPDAWRPDLLIDLKTTKNADPRHFNKTVADFGYHQSHAHYVDGIKAVTGEELPFLFVLVEKFPPYLVSVVELHPLAVDMGRRLNTRAKRIYQECTKTGIWPGYPRSEQIELPAWAAQQMEGLLNHD